MQGIFNIHLRDAAGYSDDDFEKAIQDGTIEELLSSLKVVQHVKAHNMIFDMWAANALWRCFSGGGLGSPHDKSTGEGSASCGIIAMAFTATPPTYQETANWDSQLIHRTNDAVNSTNSGKRMGGIDSFWWVAETVAGGRQQIEFREKYIYTTTQVVANIYSVTLNFHEEANYNSSGSYTERHKIRYGRILLPTPINKQSGQVLEVEYHLRLMSL